MKSPKTFKKNSLPIEPINNELGDEWEDFETPVKRLSETSLKKVSRAERLLRRSNRTDTSDMSVGQPPPLEQPPPLQVPPLVPPPSQVWDIEESCTILLEGGFSSGKTSLVYLAAELQDLQVLEVNPSDFRTSRRVTDLLTEASKSRRLKTTDGTDEELMDCQKQLQGPRVTALAWMAADESSPISVKSKKKIVKNDNINIQKFFMTKKNDEKNEEKNNEEKKDNVERCNGRENLKRKNMHPTEEKRKKRRTSVMGVLQGGGGEIGGGSQNIYIDEDDSPTTKWFLGNDKMSEIRKLIFNNYFVIDNSPIISKIQYDIIIDETDETDNNNINKNETDDDFDILNFYMLDSENELSDDIDDKINEIEKKNKIKKKKKKKNGSNSSKKNESSESRDRKTDSSSCSSRSSSKDRNAIEKLEDLNEKNEEKKEKNEENDEKNEEKNEEKKEKNEEKKEEKKEDEDVATL
eukprot:GHVL01017473.1.p1 GENE.GHVL01017473.1~~GHVL01017473.1.p1  ORF type:complete len:465 (+),score=223.18 GHVL01017473.1:902-2296(+)